MTEVRANDDTYLIIPVYNEQKAIASVLTAASAYFKNIVCVDDGSTDGSARIIKKHSITLVRHCMNLGQGAALQTGIEYALQDSSAKFFVTFDSDGQHSIKDAEKMLEYARRHNVDVILGSRNLGKTENMGAARQIILRAAIVFSNMTTGLKLTDTHNGLRVFNRQFASDLHMLMPGMGHASEIIHIISKNKFSYKELPNTVVYSKYSKSKGQSLFNAVNIVFDLLMNRG